MLKQMLDEILRRPLDALTATMDMLGKNVPAGMTVDGMISRAAHALFRPQQDDRCRKARKKTQLILFRSAARLDAEEHHVGGSQVATTHFDPHALDPV